MQIPPHFNNVELLKEQLTRYATYIIANTHAQEKTEKNTYAIDALCGVIPSENYDGEYINDYLKEKYSL